MKKFNFREKLTQRKTVYTMAAASLLLAVIAIGIVYSQTMNALRKSLPEVSTTRQVHQNQTNEEDPRSNKLTTLPTTEPTTHKIITTAPATVISDEKEPQTTTTAVSVLAPQTYIRPHDGEIIRIYSPKVPMYCETMNDWRTHEGIDIAVKEGDEAVSVGKGKVSKVTADSTYGYTVEVDYGAFTARYCGMKQGECVGIGQSLEKGDSIGVVGTVPCEANSAPHLHFEVLVEGMHKSPFEVCKW